MRFTEVFGWEPEKSPGKKHEGNKNNHQGRGEFSFAISPFPPDKLLRGNGENQQSELRSHTSLVPE